MTEPARPVGGNSSGNAPTIPAGFEAGSYLLVAGFQLHWLGRTRALSRGRSIMHVRRDDCIRMMNVNSHFTILAYSCGTIPLLSEHAVMLSALQSGSALTGFDSRVII